MSKVCSTSNVVVRFESFVEFVDHCMVENDVGQFIGGWKNKRVRIRGQRAVGRRHVDSLTIFAYCSERIKLGVENVRYLFSFLQSQLYISQVPEDFIYGRQAFTKFWIHVVGLVKGHVEGPR